MTLTLGQGPTNQMERGLMGHAHLSLLLQGSWVQGTTLFCTTCARKRYCGIQTPKAPVAKDTAAEAREENT